MLLEQLVFALHAVAFVDFFDRQLDLIDFKRLGHIIEGAVFQGLDGGFHRSERRHDNEIETRVYRLSLAQQLKTRHLRHHQICDYQIDLVRGALGAGKDFERLNRRSVGGDFITFFA